MPVQSPADRILMEQTAADTYLPTATYTAARGAAGGLATLGSDGAVPAAQLPVGLGGFYAVKPTDTSRANTAVQAADPHLTLTLPTGLYRLELLTLNAGTGINGLLAPSGGGAATAVGTGPLLAPATAVSFAALPLALSSMGTAHRIGLLRMTTAGTLAVTWAQSSSSATASVLQAGSYLKLERLSA